MPQKSKFINNAQNVIAAIAVLITFLLPLKFGSIAAVPEVAGFYPKQLLAWLIVTWPVYCFPIIAGGLLLSALSCFQLPRQQTLKPSFTTLGLWLLLPIVGTIGFINASVMDFPIIETIHLTGIVAWGAAIWLILANRPDYRHYFYIAFLASVAVTLLLSLEQYHSGFADTREFIRAQELRTGVNVNSDIDNVLNHPRVFGPFGLCNSLAAHLLLTVPLCLALLWQWCGKIDPPKISRAIFIIPFTLTALFVLYLTGSRAALLAIISAIAIFALLLPLNKKIKILTIIVGLTGCIGGVIAMKYYGRTFASITVRIDYLLRSAEIFLKHPWAGSGWGDFFHDYMKIKTIFHKEAPHTPHNIIMAFASQTGIAGLIASVTALLYPMVYGAKKIFNAKQSILETAIMPKSMILLGLIAWTIHSMADINLQVPGTMATVMLLVIILTLPSNELKPSLNDGSSTLSMKIAWRLIAVAVAGVALYGGIKLMKFDYTMSILSAKCDGRTKTKEEFFKIQPNEIMKNLKQCTELAPYSPYPYRITAMFMANRGYIQQAQALYLEALKRSPERPSIYFQLYRLNRATGNHTVAIEYLVKAVNMFPKNEKYLKAALDEGIIETNKEEMNNSHP
jgi:hypothetical protein